VKFRRRKRLQKQNRKINRKTMKVKEKMKMEQGKQLIDGNDKMMKWRLLEKMEMKMQGWVRKRRRQDQKVRKERK
jgi:hypothetical protein